MNAQIVDSLPEDAAGIARIAPQLTHLALQRAGEEHASEVATFRETIHQRDARIAELETRRETLYTEHTALAQDLLETHEDCEILSGHKAALATTVKQLADKVRVGHGVLPSH